MVFGSAAGRGGAGEADGAAAASNLLSVPTR